KREHVGDWGTTFGPQLSGERKLRLIAQNHSGSFSPGISGREEENPMAAARFHSGDSGRSRCRAKPYIPGLLFKSRMENIGQCAGIGHSNPATVPTVTVTTETATTVTATTVIALTAML